jgi:hypothetical protein
MYIYAADFSMSAVDIVLTFLIPNKLKDTILDLTGSHDAFA